MRLGLNATGLTHQSNVFSPQSLFTAGEQGALFEVVTPAQNALTTTMWQDSVGTTPVTAVEQPVGLWLDTKRGSARGAEQVAVNFSSSAGWTLGTAGVATAASVAGGALSLPRVDSANYSYGGFSLPVTVGEWYELLFGVGVGVVQVRAGNSVNNAAAGAANSSGSSGRLIFKATVNPQWITFNPQTDAATPTVVSASMKPLPGNHATQGTTASRPTLSARYNKYRSTEALTNSTDWTASATGVATAPVVTAAGNIGPNGRQAFRVQIALNGGTTATDFAQLTQPNITGGFLNSASYKTRFYVRAYDVGNVGKTFCSRHAAGTSPALVTLQSEAQWQLVEFSEVGNSAVTSSTPAYLRGASGSSDSIDLLITMPELRTADDWALNLPLYQRVGNTGSVASDYDTVGFPHYLKFDGVDDSLSTGSIDFSATDKVTVWAGGTKLSDAAAGAIVELTADASTTNGGFALIASQLLSSDRLSYAYTLRGSAVAQAELRPYTAPVSGILSAGLDIAAVGASEFSTRVNGATATPTITGDAGTGNFANAPLYIGRRGGSSLPFNGRLTVLAVRGATTTTPTNARMEQWCAAKNGQSFAST